MSSIDMMRYIIKNQPTNISYFNLLDFLRAVSKKFMLVKRDQLKFDKNVELLFNELNPNLIKKEYSNKWPGTELLGKKNSAEIFYYKVNDDTIKILKKYSANLFDWLAPMLPEDIAFYREDGTTILWSITHEKEYWLDLYENEVQIIKQVFSNLQLEKAK